MEEEIEKKINELVWNRIAEMPPPIGDIDYGAIEKSMKLACFNAYRAGLEAARKVYRP